MSALAGRLTRIKVSTTSDGTYNDIAETMSGTINLAGEQVDITAFGDDWEQMLQGIKSATYDLSGSYDPDDATGQAVIKNAFLNDTDLFIQFLPDGTNGFQQQVRVESYPITSQVRGKVDFTLRLRGASDVTIV